MWTKYVILILSPLTALQYEQVRQPRWTKYVINYPPLMLFNTERPENPCVDKVCYKLSPLPTLQYGKAGQPLWTKYVINYIPLVIFSMERPDNPCGHSTCMLLNISSNCSSVRKDQTTLAEKMMLF